MKAPIVCSLSEIEGVTRTVYDRRESRLKTVTAIRSDL